MWALLAVPVLAVLCRVAAWRRERALARLGDAAVVSRLFPAAAPSWRRRRDWALLAALTLVALAAARPQYGRTEQTMKRAGIDALIALDTSKSMLAQDVKPNRLERAKESLKILVRALQGNRVGIIAFAGTAFLNCPMTQDIGMANMILDSLDADSIPVGGTDLSQAIKTAMGAFERGGYGTPVLVLITDGEDNEGKGLEAAKEAAKLGMRIFAIGVGTEQGAPVPDAANVYKETKTGTKVISRMDISGLAKLAEVTGGEAYAAGTDPARAVDAIARKIGRLEKADLESSKLVIHQDRSAWFIAPALALLLWAMLSRPRGMKDEGATNAGAAGAAAGAGARTKSARAGA